MGPINNTVLHNMLSIARKFDKRTFVKHVCKDIADLLSELYQHLKSCRCSSNLINWILYVFFLHQKSRVKARKILVIEQTYFFFKFDLLEFIEFYSSGLVLFKVQRKLTAIFVYSKL